MVSNGPILGAIEIGSQQWLMPVVTVLIASLGLLVLSYSTAKQSLGLKSVLILLKACGIGLLALCLLNPTLVRSQFRPGENIIVLLTDNSSSMQILDESGVSRSDQFAEVLKNDDDEWLTRLTQDFDLRKYSFDERVNQFENFSALDFRGRRSQLAAAIESIQQRFRNQPLSGIVLLTDGNASDLERLREVDLDVPVYPLKRNEKPNNVFDVAIDQVSVSESPFEDAPLEVTATVSSSAQAELKVLVTLGQEAMPVTPSGNLEPEEAASVESSLEPDVETDSGNQKLPQHEKMIIVPMGKPALVRFKLKPTHRGVAFYRLRVQPDYEHDVFEHPGKSSEATLANNERLLTVDRGEIKKRILYVGGRPNWEYKFFNRAVAEDREVKLVSLIRIARKEAKFDFRGRVGETGNSLFRGQDREADEETESYDEAVVIRLNTLDNSELSDGFPKAKEELYKYDAVILDDIEAAFFTPDQQALLERFVSERGGGLMMLGGRDSYRHGQWHKTPLRDVAPIYLDRAGGAPHGKLKWDLTREGWLEPWMRVRPTENEEKARLEEIPKLELLNSARETKPGARVFAEVEDEQGARFPSVVAHQYGQGRSVAVLIGDLWRWSIQRQEDEKDDLAKNWRQIIRWLVAEVPRQLETELEWTEIGTVPGVKLNVRLRNEEYQPKENAVVSISVQPPHGHPIQLDAEPSLSEPGLFEATYIPRDTGAYLADVHVKDETELTSQMRVGWTSQPDEEEFRQIETNYSVLESLADRSKGEVISIADLSGFVRELPQKEMPVQEIKTTPLWHSPLILLLALACFAAEWRLRRWRGMP